MSVSIASHRTVRVPVLEAGARCTTKRPLFERVSTWEERKRRKEDRERGCVVCMCVRIVKSSYETLRDTDHNSRGPVYLDITLTRENGWQKEMRPCW